LSTKYFINPQHDLEKLMHDNALALLPRLRERALFR
jgi:hypothetical protein